MRLLPEQRQSMVGAVRRGFKKTLVAEIFDVSRKTVTTWCKRAKYRGRKSFRDKKRENREVKITLKVELAIIAMRTTFDWRTARIQQQLMELLQAPTPRATSQHIMQLFLQVHSARCN